ncbi:MAG: hypothetical protein FJ335_04205 [Sphingomonadales bacterium]|nr:hypothetical protein [Sphingomonadales bacterium]
MTNDLTDTKSVTTTEGREALLANAQDAVSDAVHTAVDKVKANPKTAAAIAAGATAVIAGAVYGATKLAESKSGTKTTTKRAPAKRTTAKRTTAKS